MFGAGNALVDVVDVNANVLTVSFVMLRVKVVPSELCHHRRTFGIMRGMPQTYVL